MGWERKSLVSQAVSHPGCAPWCQGRRGREVLLGLFLWVFFLMRIFQKHNFHPRMGQGCEMQCLIFELAPAMPILATE